MEIFAKKELHSSPFCTITYVFYFNFDYILLINARSILNKFPIFQIWLRLSCPHVIGITDSWCTLTTSVSDAEL